MLINKILNKVIREKQKFILSKEDKVVREILENGLRPIYHVHIRKTAGTTINSAFLSNANLPDTDEFYDSIARKSNHRQIAGSKVFVGWNRGLIKEGLFSYAFSHTPLHLLDLPPNVFKFTCLRDPVKRVVSHYNMLMYFKRSNINHPCMKIEGEWLGGSFTDFVSNLPAEHLLNQVYMFSNSFDVHEAGERVLSLDAVIYTEQLSEGLKKLESLTSWKLPISNKKNYGHKEVIGAGELDKLREKLSPEYDLLKMVKKYNNIYNS